MKSTAGLLLLAFIFLAPSCKKKKAEKLAGTEPGPITKKMRLPVKFDSGKLVVNLKYQDKTANLAEVSDSEGYSTTITYKNDEPYQIFKKRNNIDFKLVDYVKTKEGEPKARSFDYSKPVYTPTGYYILSYDQQKRLLKILNYNDGGQLSGETTMEYDAENLISSNTVKPATAALRQSFSYDSRNGIFSQVRYTERLFLELSYPFLNSGLHNALNISNSGTPPTVFSYQYDTDNYPSQITIIKNNLSQTFVITYVEFNP